MRKGGGNAKGAAFERSVIKRLSLWVSDQEKIDLFRRSIMSGGRTTVGLTQGKEEFLEQAGDMALAGAKHTLAEVFLQLFLTEFKCYKDLQIASLIYGKPESGSIYGFWKRLIKDSKRLGKIPFMVAKQNQKPELMLTTGTGARFLEIPADKVIAVYPRLGANVFLFDTFLEDCVPAVLFTNY